MLFRGGFQNVTPPPPEALLGINYMFATMC